MLRRLCQNWSTRQTFEIPLFTHFEADGSYNVFLQASNLYCSFNLGKNIVGKFAKFSKIRFSVECFTDDFLRVLPKNIKI